MQFNRYFGLLSGALLCVCVSSSLGSGLYFSVSGDDLIVTAREADNSAQFWSLSISQAAAAAPGEGAKGAITSFYDLSGAAGSNPGFNIARGNGLLSTYFTGAATGYGDLLNAHGNAVLDAPEGVDGASSYTFSISSTFKDYVGAATASFTSTITLNAPTLEGTLFTVNNTLVTPPDWTSGSTLSEGGRESRSALAMFIEDMQGGIFESFNGLSLKPKEPDQWARLTATGESTDYADGRTFYLSQTINAVPGTADSYATVSANTESLVLTQMLSGVFRGNAAADSIFTSEGFLSINITNVAVPEPSTYAAIVGVAVLAAAILRRRKRAAKVA